MLDYDPKKLTLDNCKQFTSTFEYTQSHLKQLNSQTNEHIDSVRHSHKSRRDSKCRRVSRNGTCPFCGNDNHPREQCPASGQTCNVCKKKGHWGKMCRFSKK